MAFFQIPSPDLTNLSLGGGVLRLLESFGFSADERYLVVRGTYTDDGDASFGLHYGFWLYDVQAREYVSNFNQQIAGLDNAREIDVLELQTSGSSSDLFAVALVEIKGTNDAYLVSLLDGQVVSSNLIQSISGEQLEVKVERFLLSDDGRFLAVQTSNEQLAADDAPDTNDSSDIYLLDLQTNTVSRISYVGGSEVTDPTYLQDIHVSDGSVQIAFVTDAAFVSPSKIDINSKEVNSEANFRSDAYVWSSAFDGNGLQGNDSFRLLSVDTDGRAAGFVERENSVQITDSGDFFTSSAENIVGTDNNESNDVFFAANSGQITRISQPSGTDLNSGAIFLSASTDGRYGTYLTYSQELSGDSGAQQLVIYDRTLDITEVVSQNGQLANNWVINGTVAPSGNSVAFTSSADNLTAEPLAATAGGLFLSLSDAIPLAGQVYHWKAHALIDNVSMTLAEELDAEITPLATATTNTSGQFSLTSTLPGERLLSASKEITDNDKSRVITSADALAALKIAVGLNPNSDQGVEVSPYQMIAADVNRDGRVNSADALQILKIAVGLSDSIPQEWLFVNEGESFWDHSANSGEGEYNFTNKNILWDSEGLSFSSSDTVNANFVGALLGDVNGSWSPPEGAETLSHSYFSELEEAGVGPAQQWFSFPLA